VRFRDVAKSLLPAGSRPGVLLYMAHQWSEMDSSVQVMVADAVHRGTPANQLDVLTARALRLLTPVR
jgi:hypothetical protein